MNRLRLGCYGRYAGVETPMGGKEMLYLTAYTAMLTTMVVALISVGSLL